MRKIRIDRNTEINKDTVKWIIDKHKKEKARIAELREYYNNNNTSIMNREYKDKNKPSNKSNTSSELSPILFKWIIAAQVAFLDWFCVNLSFEAIFLSRLLEIKNHSL